jgi:hypothetical protein
VRKEFAVAEKVKVTLSCKLLTMSEIQVFLSALQRVCEQQLSSAPFPPLYESGVRYLREPRGQENWQTCHETLKKQSGDCEDLAAWRAAELRVSGRDPGAVAIIKRVRPGLIHCLVRRGNGSLEDPSKVLGMRGKG